MLSHINRAVRAGAILASCCGCGSAWAVPGWGILVSAQVNGFGGQTNSVGTGNYSGGGPLDSRTVVSVSAASPFGSAFGYANLATGKAGVSSGEEPTASSLSSVAWNDTINFNAPGFAAGLSIPLTLAVDGSFGQPGDASISFDVTYTNTGGATETQSFREALDYRGVASYSIQGNWIPSGLGETGALLVDAARPVSLFLNMTCYYNCDLLHTATFSWSLPEGVTFISASGVFLSDTSTTGTTPVPEPGSSFLVAAGVLAATLLRTRRPNGRSWCAPSARP